MVSPGAVSLITQRSEVQILSPQPTFSSTSATLIIENVPETAELSVFLSAFTMEGTLLEGFQ